MRLAIGAPSCAPSDGAVRCLSESEQGEQVAFSVRHRPPSDVSIGRNSVVIAPIARLAMANADDRAVIPMDVDGEAHVVMLHGLTAIPRHKLGKPVAQAPSVADRLPRAIDYLFLGL